MEYPAYVETLRLPTSCNSHTEGPRTAPLSHYPPLLHGLLIDHARSVSSLTILCHCTLPITSRMSPCSHKRTLTSTSFLGGHCHTIPLFTISSRPVHTCHTVLLLYLSSIQPVRHYSNCPLLIPCSCILHISISKPLTRLTHHVVQIGLPFLVDDWTYTRIKSPGKAY